MMGVSDDARMPSHADEGSAELRANHAAESSQGAAERHRRTAAGFTGFARRSRDGTPRVPSPAGPRRTSQII